MSQWALRLATRDNLRSQRPGDRLYLGFKPQSLANDIKWASLRFPVNPPDVLADDPNANQLNTADEQHRDNRTSPPFHHPGDREVLIHQHRYDRQNGYP